LSLKLPNVLRLRLEEIEGRLLSSSASVKTLALYICLDRYREQGRRKRSRRIRMEGTGKRKIGFGSVLDCATDPQPIPGRYTHLVCHDFRRDFSIKHSDKPLTGCL